MPLIEFLNDLLYEVVTNLSDYRDIYALRQTNQALRRLATV
jgi:hypothetical protein